MNKHPSEKFPFQSGNPLLGRFQAIRESIANQEISLPEQVPAVVSSQEDLIALFQIARDAWDEVFDIDKTCSIIEALYQEDERPLDPEIKEEGVAYLNEMRKFGLILKSAYLMFDERHFAPAPHYEVMKTLGNLNDDFDRPDKKEHMQKVLMALDEYRDYYPQMDFVPGSVEAYEYQYAGILENVAEKSGKKKLKTKKFHMLRQGVRNIMNVYQLAAVREDNQDILDTFGYLCDLNKDMGKLHDKAISQEIWEDIPYAESKVKMKSGIRERLDLFLQAHISYE